MRTEERRRGGCRGRGRGKRRGWGRRRAEGEAERVSPRDAFLRRDGSRPDGVYTTARVTTGNTLRAPVHRSSLTHSFLGVQTSFSQLALTQNGNLLTANSTVYVTVNRALQEGGDRRQYVLVVLGGGRREVHLHVYVRRRRRVPCRVPCAHECSFRFRRVDWCMPFGRRDLLHYFRVSDSECTKSHYHTHYAKWHSIAIGVHSLSDGKCSPE